MVERLGLVTFLGRDVLQYIMKRIAIKLAKENNEF